LTYLNLGGNKIGDEGAIAFLEVLENTSLLRLNLLDSRNYNKIGYILREIDAILDDRRQQTPKVKSASKQ
jgi:hypothetical protein